jgi:hypothetical protein
VNIRMKKITTMSQYIIFHSAVSFLPLLDVHSLLQSAYDTSGCTCFVPKITTLEDCISEEEVQNLEYALGAKAAAEIIVFGTRRRR